MRIVAAWVWATRAGVVMRRVFARESGRRDGRRLGREKFTKYQINKIRFIMGEMNRQAIQGARSLRAARISAKVNDGLRDQMFASTFIDRAVGR